MKSLPPAATFEKSWLFPAAQQAALLAYAGQFDKPFWAKFDVSVQGNTRTIRLPRFAGRVLITETLHEHGPTGYRYTLAGIPHVQGYQGWFTMEAAGPEQVRLTWKVTFNYQHGRKVLVAVARVFAGAASTMTKALRQHVSY